MHEYRATMLRVVDGDTVDIDIDLGFGVWLRKQRVRLHGIDTPESRTRDLEEKHYGKLATKYIEDRFPVGKVFTLRTYKDDKGKFGRILGELVDSMGNSVNDMMIAQSYAVPYTGQSKEDIQEAHKANYRRLSEQGFGYEDK
tara:strand:+ start:1482 stop:1907 length:426 start_codon:yes stop_codon:yes gene_type:complete